MAIQSFKNVGIKEFEKQNILNTQQSVIPIGIRTPLALGASGEDLFVMNTTLADSIHDNLRNLLLTNHGERLAQYFLGANLRPLAAEFSAKENFDDEAMVRIKSAVAKWMPFISLEGFDSRPEFIDNKFTGKIVILVIYSVPQLQILEKSLEVIIFVI